MSQPKLSQSVNGNEKEKSMNRQHTRANLRKKSGRKILDKGTGATARTMSFPQASNHRAPSRQFIEYLQRFRFSSLNERVSSRTETHLSMCPPYGKFSIPQDQMEEFFVRYEGELKNGSTLGIVEKPLPHMELPLVIDVDLKYPLDEDVEPQDIINLRKHNFQSIREVLGAYKRVYDQNFYFRHEEDKNHAFWVVTQRTEPYIVEQDGRKFVKDGWHAVNPALRAFPAVHLRMRQEVLKDERLPRVIAALGTNGTVEEVLDEAVINRNGWLLYGSTKPRREPYELAYVLDMDLRERPKDDLGAVSLPRYLSYWRVTTRHAVPKPKLSKDVTETGLLHHEVENESEAEDGSDVEDDGDGDEKVTVKLTEPPTGAEPDFIPDLDLDDLEVPDLDAFNRTETKDDRAEKRRDLKDMKKRLSKAKPSAEVTEEKKGKKKKKKKKTQTVEVIEAVNPDNAEGGATEKVRVLIDMLCERRATVKSLWLEIGACVKNLMKRDLEEEFLQLWIDFSEEYDTFDEDDCRREWPLLNSYDGADLPTLKFWASKDSPKVYKEFKRNEVRQFLTKCLNTTHVDVAQTLYLMYESQYVCASYKNNVWYEFTKGGWNEIEGGASLRRRISKELAREYARFRRYCIHLAENAESDECPDVVEYSIPHEQWEDIWDDICTIPSEEWLRMAECCEDLLVKLKTKGYKDSVLAEAKELFFDREFEEKLNERHELLRFANGVVDLEKRIFREGRPDDFITFTTKTRYVANYERTKEYAEIMAFLKQIYLSDEMVHYALKERAHTIHGDNTEERIFSWIGGGGNGKSKFRELNTRALGDYAFGFPVTLFTGRRAQSSTPMPEVARAKGRRMAFVDEPEENQRLNMGLMKKLSGGDPMEVRKLYGDTFEFIPQFSITILCNDPPKVPPHDEGTRRRLTCDPHDARFVKNPTKPNEFKRDLHLSRKIRKWCDVYATMLVEYYYIYQEEGLNPPEVVTKFTQQFLRECDAYDEFISDTLVELEEEAEESFISLQALYGSFKAWVEDNGVSSRKPMSFRDFRKYLKKKIKQPGLLKETRLYGYRERSVQEMGGTEVPTY